VLWIAAADQDQEKNRVSSRGYLEEASGKDYHGKRRIAFDDSDLLLEFTRHHETAADEETVDSGLGRIADKRRESLILNLVGINEDEISGTVPVTNG